MQVNIGEHGDLSVWQRTGMRTTWCTPRATRDCALFMIMNNAGHRDTRLVTQTD